MSIKKAILCANEIINKYSLTPPIDLNSIIEKEQIKLYVETLPEKVSGIFISQNKEMFISKDDSDKRKRFSIAHELGHYFLKHFHGIHVDKLSRDSSSAEGLYNVEIEANNFAAELLVPSHSIKQKMLNYLNKKNIKIKEIINELALFYKVSDETITNRLKNLGYIAEA